MAVLAATASGITPGEGVALVQMIEATIRALEAGESVKRVDALEEYVTERQDMEFE